MAANISVLRWTAMLRWRDFEIEGCLGSFDRHDRGSDYCLFSDCGVTRARARGHRRGSAGAFVLNTDRLLYVYAGVAAKDEDRLLQVVHERYEPGVDTGPETLAQSGEEAGVVVWGEITVTVGALVSAATPPSF